LKSTNTDIAIEKYPIDRTPFSFRQKTSASLKQPKMVQFVWLRLHSLGWNPTVFGNEYCNDVSTNAIAFGLFVHFFC